MFWQKIRNGVMFVISFVTCPCHLPITLPIALALLAGTPAAYWISQHVGWVYGILGGVFFLSLALGFVWTGSTKENEVCEPRSISSMSSAPIAKNE